MSSTEDERRKELAAKLHAKVRELLPEGVEVTSDMRARYREGMREFFRKELFAVAGDDEPFRSEVANVLADLMTGSGDRKHALVMRMFDILNKAKPDA